MKPLTKRQAEVFEFYRRQIEGGKTPTIKQTAEALDMGAARALQHVNALVRKGYLQRLDPGRNCYNYAYAQVAP